MSREAHLGRAALQLAARGLAVFPCRPSDKRPACARGCLDATTNTALIEHWWQTEPRYNVAIATGMASSVFVIDVDSLDAEAELRKLETEHGELPPTVESITARGRHIWFQYPDRPVKNSVGRLAPGIDTRGDGGYALVPPSIHPSGRPYCWSTETANSFAAAPGWLLDKIAEPTNGARPVALPPAHWRELVLGGLNEGARNNSLTRLTGFFLRRNVDAILVLEIIRSLNTTHCHPSLPDDDIVRIVESIAARDLNRRQSQT